MQERFGGTMVQLLCVLSCLLGGVYGVSPPAMMPPPVTSSAVIVAPPLGNVAAQTSGISVGQVAPSAANIASNAYLPQLLTDEQAKHVAWNAAEGTSMEPLRSAAPTDTAIPKAEFHHQLDGQSSSTPTAWTTSLGALMLAAVAGGVVGSLFWRRRINAVTKNKSATEMAASSSIVWAEAASSPTFAVAALASKEYFDPVGLKCSNTPKTLDRRREAEVEHGRQSMLVCLGHTMPAVAAGLANGARVRFRSEGARMSQGGAIARRAEAKAAPKAKAAAAPTKYMESAADKRLFEQVYHAYTEEYLKGPLYFHEDKLQGWQPYYPGNPLTVNGKLTSNVVGNLKTFSSNELAFFSMLFFGTGLYGHFMFNWGDPQLIKADQGIPLNGSYILEAYCLPISFFFHIACYIQKKNGK